VNYSVIHEVLAETQAGKLIFPEVVRRLLEVGVESYFCDLATGVETLYLSDGKSFQEKMILPLSPVAEEFSSSDVIAAIRGAQSDTIRYPEFIKHAAAAGVIAYWAFLWQEGHLFWPQGPVPRRGFSSPKPVNSTPERNVG
jgi:uncharacterized protein YbcV (DUF1398 family)